MGWDKGSSNVQWCEAYTHEYAFHPCCAELANTVTNICSFSVALLGLYRTWKRKGGAAFLFTDLVLLVVAVGSALFHMTRSYYSELLDELPMLLMGVGYLWVLRDRHWLTSGRLWLPVFLIYIATATSAAGAYLYHKDAGKVEISVPTILSLNKPRRTSLQVYDIFTLTFTAEVVFAALLSVAAGGRKRLGIWLLFLACIVAGRGVWGWERRLHRAQQCPTDPSDPKWWLHSIWHFFSAAAHGIWMYYVSLLPVLKPRKVTKTQASASSAWSSSSTVTPGAAKAPTRRAAAAASPAAAPRSASPVVSPVKTRRARASVAPARAAKSPAKKRASSPAARGKSPAPLRRSARR